MSDSNSAATALHKAQLRTAVLMKMRDQLFSLIEESEVHLRNGENSRVKPDALNKLRTAIRDMRVQHDALNFAVLEFVMMYGEPPAVVQNANDFEASQSGSPFNVKGKWQ